MALVTGITYPNDGDRIKVANYNTPIQAILAQLNGNLDNTNISGIDGSKVAAGTLPFSALKTDNFSGWVSGQMPLPTTITYNGQRSYSMVFNTVDLSTYLSPGMRLRTTRTVAAPTQSTSLNGTNQYWNNTSPNKMTFTNNFVVGAWVKLSSYSATDMIVVSRFNGTSGWRLNIKTTGQIDFTGFNGGAGNYSQVVSSQSVPLNKWVHIAAQLDMSTFTATNTTSYIMMDGIDVPASVARVGTNPTSLIQAGNLEIGSVNGGTLLFPGKIAQVAIFGAKVTQATMQTYMSQGYTGTETNLVSAWSFNGVATDLFTTTPNNLTAQNAAGYTTDSPFGGQANGTISSTLDYGIIQSVTFSTNTTLVVQVPEGCTIPTSGGIAAVSYTSAKSPFGFPGDKNKWRLTTLLKTNGVVTPSATYGPYLSNGYKLTVPAGSWEVGHQSGSYYASSADTEFALSSSPLTGLTGTPATNVTQLIVRVLATSTSSMVVPGRISVPFPNQASQVYILYTLGATGAASGIDGTQSPGELFAENTLL